MLLACAAVHQPARETLTGGRTAVTADQMYEIVRLVLTLLAAGAGSWLFQRRRERITWQESAKGALAKLRHEAVAKVMAGAGKLLELHLARERFKNDFAKQEIEEAAYRKAAMEPLGDISAHGLLLPPVLRREVFAFIERMRPSGGRDDFWEGKADRLCLAVDKYLPALDTPKRNWFWWRRRAIEKMTSAQNVARARLAEVREQIQIAAKSGHVKRELHDLADELELRARYIEVEMRLLDR